MLKLSCILKIHRGSLVVVLKVFSNYPLGTLKVPVYKYHCIAS